MLLSLRLFDLLTLLLILNVELRATLTRSACIAPVALTEANFVIARLLAACNASWLLGVACRSVSAKS